MPCDAKKEEYSSLPRVNLPDVISFTSHRLTLDMWLAKDNRFLNPKSSYERILTAPPCRLIKIREEIRADMVVIRGEQ